MKGLIYFIIVVVPIAIIGTTIYFTRGWSITSFGTIATWFIAWLVSMVLVTLIYLKLMPLTKSSADEDSETTDQNKNEEKRE